VATTHDLRGSQEATTRILPRGRADTDAAELATHISLPLDIWQREILTESARTDGRKWSAFEVATIAPRQNGKSYLVIIRALAGALIYGEKLILYSAHEYRTAQETWRLMRDVCESDHVAKYVKRIRTMAGGEVIEFTNGARFKMIARTRTSGRGFSPDCLLLDESFALSAEVMSALLPSVAARPNPQIWYLSSAGTWESEVLLNLRRRGHQPASSRFAYWEWHAEETDDYRDPRIHAQANPAYGSRITAESVARELESMPRRAFLRERLGVWSETTVETVFEEEAIQAATVERSPAPTDGRPIGWGADAAWDRTGACIAAAFYASDGIAEVALVQAAAGAGWLPERIGELADRYGIDPIAFDARGGITDLMERCERDYNIRPAPMRHADYPAACANFAQRIADRTIRIQRAPMLISDAIGATAQTTSNGWIWSRKGTTPPTALIAATAALWALEHNDSGSGIAVY